MFRKYKKVAAFIFLSKILKKVFGTLKSPLKLREMRLKVVKN
jgi:hypothetical protein